LNATVPVVETTGLKTDRTTGITWIRARCAAGMVKPALAMAALSVTAVFASVREQAVIAVAPSVRLLSA
jgi:hypothetical protein